MLKKPGVVGFRVHDVATGDQTDPAPFRVEPAVSLSSGLMPNAGPVNGGTEVLVHFDGRWILEGTQPLWCRFGDNGTRVRATVMNPESVHSSGGGMIRCTSPPSPFGVYGREPGRVSVEVSSSTKRGVNELHSHVSLDFEYELNAVLLSATPNGGPVDGGTRVVVKGTGFKPTRSTATCQFGSQKVRATVVDFWTIECEPTPPVLEEGRTTVGVSLNGVDSARSDVLFTYLRSLRIEAISPSSGPERGGTQISIRGANFQASAVGETTLWCSFSSAGHEGSHIDGNTTAADVIDGGLARCVLPPGLMPGIAVRLGLTRTPGQHVAFAAQNVSIYATEVLTAIAPQSGGLDGGTLVRVSGRNFFAEEGLSCRFDGKAVVPGTFVSPELVECRSPPASLSGPVVVEVASNGVDFCLSDVLFRYVPGLRILEMAPRSGPIDGGTRLVLMLQGDNILLRRTSLQCVFETEQLPAVLLNESAAVCVSPRVQSARRASVGLAVDNDVAVYARNNPYFTYFAPARALRIASPSFVYESGRTDVIVQSEAGFIFDRALYGNAVLCRFGEHSIVAGRRRSDAEIACPSPRSLAPGAVTVAISNDGEHFSVAKGTVDVLPVIAVVSVNPAKGRGGTPVIATVNFVVDGDARSVSCWFGSVPSPAILSDNSTKVRCEAAPVPATPGVVTVTVGYVGVVPPAHHSRVYYEYLPRASLSSVFPTSGSIAGGTVLSLSGDAFPIDEVRCRFSLLQDSLVIRTRATVVSSKLATCATPAISRSQRALIDLEFLDDVTAVSLPFQFQQSPRIKSLAPKAGPANGGSLVTVFGEHLDEGSILWCRFGDAPAAPGVRLTSTLARCVAPSAADAKIKNYATGDLAEVALSTNSVDFFGNVSFAFYDDAIVESVDPASATVGTALRVRGSFFEQSGTSARCCFVGVALAACVEPSGRAEHPTQELDCAVPSVIQDGLSNRDFRVFVSLNGGIDYLGGTSAPFLLQDAPPPSPTGLSPKVSAMSGGTILAVSGQRLASGPEPTCRFNGSIAVRALVVDTLDERQQLLCETPDIQKLTSEPAPDSLSFGVSVEVSVDGRFGFVRVPDLLYYLPVPSVRALAPSTVLEIGGAVVTVIGDDFVPSSQLACRFDGSAVAKATFRSPQAIECVAPRHAPSEHGVCVDVTVNGIDFTADCTATLTYVSMPALLAATPSYVVQDRATDEALVRLRLTRTNRLSFATSSTTVVCSFGG
ncbi:MAG: IPT/TIG domain-containing protein, partial [Myxococcota bacterium]